MMNDYQGRKLSSLLCYPLLSGAASTSVQRMELMEVNAPNTAQPHCLQWLQWGGDLHPGRLADQLVAGLSQPGIKT
eukprot:1142362-Pelagomonas_calceolata.AAC.12